MPSTAGSTLETVVPCVDLDAMTTFFVERLGLRVETISPADDPAEIVLAGLGARLRLRRSTVDAPVALRIRTELLDAAAAPETIVAPNGSVVEVVSASTAVVVPPSRPSLSIVRAGAGDAFGAGRAGMGYRDLLPDRWGGRFIASHIRIDEGGDVADYVHFHRIRFQLIFVAAGWVEVVYEDQGPPFRMTRGDCVLQPPEIRHRVLRSSPGLEVIEVGCPAVHDTVVEHDIALPTPAVRPERDFGGQRFLRHVAAESAVTRPVAGMTCRDTGLGRATAGLADARVLVTDPTGPSTPVRLEHGGEFAMSVVLAGTAHFDAASPRAATAVGPRDAVAIPSGTTWSWSDRSDDFELLEVMLPAGAVTTADARE